MDYNMKEQTFWDLHSTIAAIVRDPEEYIVDEAYFNVLNTIPALTVDKVKMPTSDNPYGRVDFEYNGEKIYFYFMLSEYSREFPHFQNQVFSDEDIDLMKKSGKALINIMKFDENPQASYKLQLEIIYTLMPDMICLVDESSEQVFNKLWVKQTIMTDILPDPNSLYAIQAVWRDDLVWLHTHGLSRCGLTELEILDLPIDNYSDICHLISALATRLIENVAIDDEYNTYHNLGESASGMPIVTQILTWDNSITYYNEDTLGGANDRVNDHNTLTSLIFLVGENDQGESKLFKISDFVNELSYNPIYYISDKATLRASQLAQERLSYLKKAIEIKKSGRELTALAKICIDANEEVEKEHLWYNIIEIQKQSIIGTLIQDSFYHAHLKEGSSGVSSPDKISDWLVYYDNLQITPSNSYIIDVIF